MRQHLKTLVICSAVFVLCGFGFPDSQAIGQSVEEAATENVENVPFDTDPGCQLISIMPMAEPSPALMYNLMPGFPEQRPGNAAVFYGKVMAEQTNFFGNGELVRKIEGLSSAPLSEIKTSEIAANAIPESSYRQLRYAALCETCDWQIPIRYERLWDILLPELQQTRMFARLLATRARYQIANADFDGAIETLQTGYALARNDSTGPTFVHQLVAVSIKLVMDEQLECLIQQPDAPNMYWALASMPDPLLNLQTSAGEEQNFLVMSYPELADLSPAATAKYSDEHWRELLIDVLELSILAQGNNFEDPESRKEAMLKAADLESGKFELAKRLLAESGRTADQIASMSKSETVLIAATQEYKQQNQDVMKWAYVPYFQAAEHVNLPGGDEEAEDREAGDENEQVADLSGAFAPSLHTIITANVRVRRRLATQMLIESIRAHAALNNGQLPETVEDLTALPVPFDPVTGKPFVCELENGVFVVTGPALPGSTLNLKIKIREP